MSTKNLYTIVKQGFGLLLALAMLFSFVSVQVLAYEEVYTAPAGIAIAPLGIVQVNTWADLRNEVNAAGVIPTIIELTEDIYITTTGTAWNAITIPAESDITLTGGYTITRVSGNTQRHFTVNGILRLENVALNGNAPLWVSNHGGITVNTGGRLIMEAGSVIQNNRNTTGSQGGGVTVTGVSATFTMNGGEISGNIGGTGAGGLFVGAGGLFTMTDGALSNNSITGNTGGAVSVQGVGSRFIMDGGVIFNNVGRFGGGVRIGASGIGTPTLTAAPSMHMAGGEIYGNTAFFGGGVNLEWGLFTMEDGIIQNNTATGLANPPATTIQANRGGGGVFVQNSGIFTMASGLIHDNDSYTHGGGVSLIAGTTFNLDGGTISDNTAATNGGGVAAALLNAAGNPVAGTIMFNMTSGTITGNTAVYGGGISLTPGNNTAGTGSLFTMTAGTISGNTAANDGGGIWLSTGTATTGARLNMTGGEISDNTAIGTGTPLTGNGGGIFTSAFIYSDPLPPTAYANILAANGIFSGNTAGNGKFASPTNYFSFSFGELLTNYDINYIGSNPRARITFILNGGNIAGDTANRVYSIPLGYTIGEAQIIPEPELLNHTLIGWTRDDDPTILSVEDVKALYIEESTIFTAQWVLMMHTVTFAPGSHGTLAGGTPNVTLNVTHGTILTAADIPDATPHTGWVFIGWTPSEPLNHTVTAPITFIAQWESLSVTPMITITYLSGTNGIFLGGATVASETLNSGGGYPSQVPMPIANTGFHFIGWRRDGDTALLSTAALEALFIDYSTTFIAMWSNIPGNGGIEPPSPPLPPLPPTLPSRQAYLIGSDDGLIRPQANITRAEVATIFFRLIDDTARTRYWTQTNPFPDVALNHWFNNAVSTTTHMGIFQGRPDGTFAPTQAITRAELTTAVARFMDITGLATIEDNLFSDIHGHWANAYINAMAVNNLVQGPHGQGGAFYPDRPITRAETAAIINRIFGRLPESSADLLPDMVTWPDNVNTSAWYYLYLQSASNSYTYQMKQDGIHERWIAIIPVRNWAALEQQDSTPESLWK